MSEEEPFTTQDMGLAIALLCSDYQLVGLQTPSSGQRITFCFQTANNIEQASQSYWDGKLNVDAKNFWNESKNLKTRLYSLK